MSVVLYCYTLFSLRLLLPLFLLFLFWRSSSSTKRNKNSSTTHLLPPSPPRLPIIGNLHQVGPIPQFSLRDLSLTHGPLMLLQLGRVPTLVITSPFLARQVLSVLDLSFASRPALILPRTLFCGTSGLGFTPYGDYWKKLKKIVVNHLLSPKMVKSFQHVCEQEVAVMLAKISSLSSSSSSRIIDMSEVLSMFTVNVVYRVFYGMPSRSEATSSWHKRICKLVEDGVVLLGAAHVGDFFPMLGWLDVFLGNNEGKAKKNADGWSDTLEQIIDYHVERLGNKQSTHSKDDDDDDEDFVDVLLSLQDSEEISLSRQEIKGFLAELFGAGIEPFSAALVWSLTELVRNPHVLKKLKDEVRSVCIASGNNTMNMVKEEDLGQMRYLKAVIKEVLRLHPSVPLLLPREAREDCQVQGYEISKKTRVLINAWAIHRDPSIWDSPEEFKPERFIENPMEFKASDFTYFPFGGGRRSCPGMNFAVATTELVVANLMSAFDWSLPDGMKSEDLNMDVAPGFSGRKKEKLYLKVSHQHKS